ncbi:MAG TPA: ABC transporter substrate-binding protein [Clostridiales bacterium]|nr:ABC transporter substrate-binding protein [Clostridiales bacterium]
MKKISLNKMLPLFICISLLLTACSTANDEKASSDEVNVPVNSVDDNAEKPAEPTERVVTDMAGRTVAIPDEINSIATFGANGVLNAFVELMGEGSKICHDMSPSFTKTDKWKYQYVFAPQMKGAPVFEDANREVIIETVLQNKPDVCFTMTKDTAEYLEQNGLTVVFLSWSDLDDVKKAVNLMGEVLNKKDIAADYIEYFDKMVAQAEKLTENIGDKQKKVLYGNVIELSQPHRIAEWWITRAGGKSVTDNGRTEETFKYTLEDLLQWNPDVMVVTAKKQIKEIKEDSRLSEINAVKNNEIYYIPTVAHVWGNRTVEQPLTIYWTMNKLYPEIVTDEMLAKEIKYFYSHFFLYELSDDQVEEIMK